MLRQFFFNTLKKKRKGAVLPMLLEVQVEEGPSPHEALTAHVKNHFRQLYSSQPSASTWEQDWAARYREFPCKVSDAQREALEKPITENEVYQALLRLLRGKSLGKDGFPAEFYLWGWDFVKGILLHTIEEVWKTGSMGRELNEGLIVLIPKDNSHLSVGNWHPITL